MVDTIGDFGKFCLVMMNKIDDTLIVYEKFYTMPTERRIACLKRDGYVVVFKGEAL